jgi:hypothetical protein
MTEFLTNPMFITAALVVVAAGGYGALAWFQHKWPVDPR